VRASREVVIVGGGIVGLCVGFAAQRRGCGVTIIDRSPAESHDGCSFGNMGMIVPSHFVPLATPELIPVALKCLANPRSPFYIAPRADWGLIRWGWQFLRAATPGRVARAIPLLRDLSVASRELFTVWLSSGGASAASKDPREEVDLVERGLLMLCKTQRAFEHEAALAEKAGTLGIVTKVLHNAAEIAAAEPATRVDALGAVHFLSDCHIDPARFIEWLRAKLLEAGAKFFMACDVKKFRHGPRDRIAAVETSAGEIRGDSFIICTGAWSPALVRELGVRLTMQPGKGYSLTLRAPARVPRLCAILTEARVAMTPIGGTVRFGGTMELGGFNRRIDRRRVDGIIDAATDYYPDFARADFAAVEPWCGLRPCSPDGLPFLGRLRRFANVFVATGHGMLGLSLGPVTGELIADLLMQERPRFDLELLSPER
jgi:D-amino-acid dehydrogenase